MSNRTDDNVRALSVERRKRGVVEGAAYEWIPYEPRSRGHARRPPEDPPLLATHWYSEVTFRERCADGLSALWDALVSRVHRYADPCASYASYLDTLIEMASKRTMPVPTEPELDTLKEESPETRAQKELRAEVAYQEEAIKIYEDSINRIGTDYYKDMEQSVNDDIEKVRPDYDSWFRALRRPAYVEKFQDLDEWKASQTKEDPTSLPWYKRLRNWVQETIGRYALPALVPLEIVFARPAFEFITPERPFAATASAFIFTGLLVAAGWGFASSLTRARVSFVKGDRGSVRDRIASHWQPTALTAAGLFLLLGLAVATVGADLRGKLPAIDRWNAEMAQVQRDRKTLESNYQEALPEQNSELHAEQQRIETVEKRLAERYDEILVNDLKFRHSDQLLALVIYVMVFAAAAWRRLVARDPWFEYEILALAVRELHSMKRWIVNQREAQRRYFLDQIMNAKMILARTRSRLGIVAPDDDLALPPKPADSVPSSKAEKSAQPDIEPSKEQVLRSWKANRLRRYTRWYLIVAGDKLSRYAADIPKHLGSNGL